MLTFKSPLAFGVAAQVFGIAKVAPVYFACSLFSEEPTGFGRRVDWLTVMSVFPATIIGHILPSVLMNTVPITATEVSRSYFTLQSMVCYAFYLSPITVSVLTKGFSAGVKWLMHKWNSMLGPTKEATNKQDAQHESDLPALQTAYSMMLAFQAIQHLPRVVEYMRYIYEVLEPFSWPDRWALLMNMRPGSTSYIFGADQEPAFSINSSLTLFTSSTIAFLLYKVWSLRRRGFITNCEAVKAVLGLSAALFVPGAAYAGIWLWREKVLYRVTHHSRPKSRIHR